MSKHSELLTSLLEKRTKAASARRRFEQDWALNLAYVEGKQHVTWMETTNSLAELDDYVDTDEVRITRNVMNKFIRRERAKIMKTSPTPVALPVSDNQRDVITARIASAWFRQVVEEVRFERRLRDCIEMWTCTTGNGFHKWWWDGHHKKPRVTVVPPFEVLFDPYATSTLDARWVIHSQFMPKDTALQLYGKKHEDVLRETTQDAQSIYPIQTRLGGNYLDAGENALSGVIVHEYWEIPNPVALNGRFVVFTEDGIISDMEFPYQHKRLPFTHIGHTARSGSMWYRSGLDQVRVLQDELNRTEEQIVENRNLSQGKWAINELLEMEEEPDAQPRQILKYSGPAGLKPEFIAIDSMPSWVGNEPDRILAAMMDIVGQNEVSNAGVPGRVESASAIQLLQEADDSIIQDIVSMVEDAIADGFSMLLSYLHQFGDPVIQVKLYDKNGMLEKMELKKDSLSLDMRVVCRSTSGLPMSIAGRWDRVLMLKQHGVLTDPVKLLELLDMPSEEFDLNSDQQDRSNAYRENRRMARGEPLVARQQDNHQAHREEHWKYMKTPEYEMLPPETKEMFEFHVATHDELELQLLGQEATKQMVLSGQAPAPPPELTATQVGQQQQENGAAPPVPLPNQGSITQRPGPADAPTPPAPQDNGSPAQVA